MRSPTPLRRKRQNGIVLRRHPGTMRSTPPLRRKRQQGIVLHRVTKTIPDQQNGSDGHPAYCGPRDLERGRRQCLSHRSRNPRSGTSLKSVHSTPTTPTVLVSLRPLMNFSPLTLRQSLVRRWTGPTTMPSPPLIGFLPPSRRSRSPNVRRQRLLHSELMFQTIASDTIPT